jgi:hypothetical protein
MYGLNMVISTSAFFSLKTWRTWGIFSQKILGRSSSHPFFGHQVVKYPPQEKTLVTRAWYNSKRDT